MTTEKEKFERRTSDPLLLSCAKPCGYCPFLKNLKNTVLARCFVSFKGQTSPQSGKLYRFTVFSSSPKLRKASYRAVFRSLNSKKDLNLSSFNGLWLL